MFFSDLVFTMEPIETKRLYLRRLETADARDIFEYGRDPEVARHVLWEAYTSDLAMAVNNIHMILDCDVMLGGYVGSRIGAHIEQVREKAAGRNTFSEDGGYIRACSGGNRTAAMGAALGIIETFLEKI